MRIRYWSSDVCSSDLAEEEARLAVLGCHILLEPGDGPALIFDIGGGSTELVLVDTEGPAPHILDWQSAPWGVVRSEEHTSELQSLMRISYAVFCLKKKNQHICVNLYDYT